MIKLENTDISRFEDDGDNSTTNDIYNIVNTKGYFETTAEWYWLDTAPAPDVEYKLFSETVKFERSETTKEINYRNLK